MTKRRFAKRKQSSGLSFKTLALIFGLLIAVAIFTPFVSEFIDEAKGTARTLTLDAGFVDPTTCVVTGAYAIDCADHAVGTPLREALDKMRSHDAELAAEKQLRTQAESAARLATAEVVQLRAKDAASTARATQQQASRTLSSTTRPDAARSGDTAPATVARTKPSEDDVLPVTVIPVDDATGSHSYFPAEQSEAQ